MSSNLVPQKEYIWVHLCGNLVVMLRKVLKFICPERSFWNKNARDIFFHQKFFPNPRIIFDIITFILHWKCYSTLWRFFCNLFYHVSAAKRVFLRVNGNNEELKLKAQIIAKGCKETIKSFIKVTLSPILYSFQEVDKIMKFNYSLYYFYNSYFC